MNEIYIQLLDEGTTVFRPTNGVSLGGDKFLVLPTNNYESSDESWEFLPGSTVMCKKELKGGEEVLVAYQLA